MADIHVERAHALGLAKARKLAFKWAEQAEEQLDMACTYEEGTTVDTVSFERSGVSGTLEVTASAFTLEAKLGFLFSAFKGKIEAEISKNLDTLLEAKTPAKSAAKASVKTALKATGKPPAGRKKA
ncbi:MAG: polyhydroxyalkanoic acid system family protein [Burkholderiales bacterium]